CHTPQWVDGLTTLAGHLHPAVTLHGRGGDSVRLPCFWIRERLVVLPAFGAFTGGASIRRDSRARVAPVPRRGVNQTRLGRPRRPPRRGPAFGAPAAGRSGISGPPLRGGPE